MSATVITLNAKKGSNVTPSKDGGLQHGGEPGGSVAARLICPGLAGCREGHAVRPPASASAISKPPTSSAPRARCGHPSARSSNGTSPPEISCPTRWCSTSSPPTSAARRHARTATCSTVSRARSSGVMLSSRCSAPASSIAAASRAGGGCRVGAMTLLGNRCSWRTPHTDQPAGLSLGFPRMGVARELKWALERVPVGDFSLYDHVLDAALAVGAVPERFGARPVDPVSSNDEDLRRYFVMARGGELDGVDQAPLELTKWLDTNCHHLVPEFAPDQVFTARRRVSPTDGGEGRGGHIPEPCAPGRVADRHGGAGIDDGRLLSRAGQPAYAFAVRKNRSRDNAARSDRGLA